MMLTWANDVRLRKQYATQARLTCSGWSVFLVAALVIPASSLAADDSSGADKTIFDVSALKARGLDAKVGEMFSQSPRFLPGESTVALTVNGSARGKFKVFFDQDGKLCADEAFQKNAGLIAAPGFTEQAAV